MKKFSSTTKGNFPRSFSVRKGWGVVVVVVLGVLIVLVLPSVLSQVGSVLMSPFAATARWAQESPSAIPMYFRQRADWLRERDELQAKIDREVGGALTVARLTEENIALRAFVGNTTSERLLVRIIARPPFLAYDRIQVDKGARHGVTVGAPVFAGRDVVVGSVVSVAADYSFIELVSAPGFLSTVYVPELALSATMEGVGGGVARVRVPQGVRVVSGQTVILLAYDPGIFGEITHVEGDATKPEQYAYVTLPVSLQSLRYLSVGREPVTPRHPEDIASSTRALIAESFLLPEAAALLVPTSSATSSLATSTIPTL